MVRVCDVPLSVHDQEIVNALRQPGIEAEIVGEVIKEKLRVKGKLVNCLTGNRRVEIKIPKNPLPRYIAVNDLKARIYHPGQPQNKDVTCNQCLEKGHYSATSRNEQKCKECKQNGTLDSSALCT